jgi:hypothetical protein
MASIFSFNGTSFFNGGIKLDVCGVCAEMCHSGGAVKAAQEKPSVSSFNSAQILQRRQQIEGVCVC